MGIVDHRAPCTRPCAQLCTEAGFAAAYQAHRSRLVAGARSVLGDTGLAEDAVQEAFLRAWSACATYDATSGPPLISWLLRITRNVVIDHVRARAARPQPSSVDPGSGSGPEPADHRCATDSVVLRSLLIDALATVSEQHRSVLVQAIVRDRRYVDVAADLGVPVGTVKSRVHYALRALRCELEPA